MRAEVPVAIFFGMFVILYPAYLVRVPELVSVLLLIPLLVWVRMRNRPGRPSAKTNPTLQRALYSTLGLYLLVMIVRTPSVFFLGFPLEKTPLVFLLVSWVLYVERKPLVQYGFRWGRLPNQAMLGGFLYLGSQLIPLLATLGLLVFS